MWEDLKMKMQMNLKDGNPPHANAIKMVHVIYFLAIDVDVVMSTWVMEFAASMYVYRVQNILKSQMTKNSKLKG